MTNQFKYCPQCESDQIEQTDYELADGSEDENGRRCLKCNWEGDVSELVCKDDQ
jgi:hypothetical protein